jgi:hypothetical protein
MTKKQNNTKYNHHCMASHCDFVGNLWHDVKTFQIGDGPKYTKPETPLYEQDLSIVEKLPKSTVESAIDDCLEQINDVYWEKENDPYSGLDHMIISYILLKHKESMP